tara:strand:+ start:1781 stop:2827 length:1047 start_codon:yes stop_codon:yes gene_type:complete
VNEDIEIYKGKPTAYLDHNILDLFVKHELSAFLEELKNQFQIIYSDETLKEIKRSNEYANNFLDVLEKFEAAYLKIQLGLGPTFIPTGQATINILNPFEVYDEYCRESCSYDDALNVMNQQQLKFNGGRKGTDLKEIHDEQREAFELMLDNIMDSLGELEDDLPEIRDIATQECQRLREQFDEALTQTEETIKNEVGDDTNWSGLKAFRDFTGVGPVQLNNIEPPNVLEKIYAQYKDQEPFTQQTIEEFFGASKHPIYPDQPYFNFQKVTSVYTYLNALGYYPDSKVHNERRFIAAQSDTSHASMAVFANYLLSRDKNFVMKVRAAYEFLGIDTNVQQVNVTFASESA